MASNTQNSKVILFDDADDFAESEGYILIRVINHGTQGQTSIVRSVSNGEFYIRKQLIKRADQPKTEELNFCHRIPYHMAPQVIESFNSQYVAPTIIYAFCNGGDSGEFLQKYQFKCCGAGVAIPEALFWHLEKELLRTLAFIHSGWQEGLTPPSDWLMHASIHEGNIFLNWAPGNDPSPQFLLGDWGLARHPRNYNTTLPGMRRRCQGRELRHFLNTLFALNVHISQDVAQQDCPIWLFQELWKEAEEQQKLQPELGLAQYICERFIPIANRKIQQLQRMHFHDLRWTKPEAPDGFLTFGSEEETAIDAYKSLFGRKKIIQPWMWVDIEDIPDVVFEKAGIQRLQWTGNAIRKGNSKSAVKKDRKKAALRKPKKTKAKTMVKRKKADKKGATKPPKC